MVDEAQGLSTEVLQDIRYILNIGARYPGSLQIFLSGQPEIRTTIAGPSLQNLQQRIFLHASLEPFSENETRAYIDKRLSEAGNPTGRLLFEPTTYADIARLSGGIPRVINIICENALLLGHLKRVQQIDRGTIIESIKDLDFLDLPKLQALPPSQDAEPQTPRRGWFRRLFATSG
jgi:general secretion pathway protein A